MHIQYSSFLEKTILVRQYSEYFLVYQLESDINGSLCAACDLLQSSY